VASPVRDSNDNFDQNRLNQKGCVEKTPHEDYCTW